MRKDARIPAILAALAAWGALAQIAPRTFTIDADRRAIWSILFGPWTPWIAGLLIVGIMVVYILRLEGRVTKLEEEVERRNQAFTAWKTEQNVALQKESRERFERMTQDLNAKINAFTARQRTKGLAETGISLVYDARLYPSCREEVRANTWAYRLAVLNTASRTIDGVKFYLEAIHPRDLSFSNVELLIMHDRPPYTASLSGISINPGTPTQFVDILYVVEEISVTYHNRTVGRTSPSMSEQSMALKASIPVARSGLNSELPSAPSRYRLTIKGEAPNTMAFTHIYEFQHGDGLRRIITTTPST